MRPESIAFPAEPLGPVLDPAGAVRVRWLGTAGFAISHGAHTILIDPYVTRASIARCATGPIVSDVSSVYRYTPHADAIIVGHSHFDHVLDVPTIARHTGAHVFGSRSTAAVCRMAGIAASRVTDVEREAGAEPVTTEVGPFRLRFFPSAHSKLLLGRVPAAGEISDCGDVPMGVRDYRCGAVFGVELRVAGRTLYHVGSAEIVDAHVRARDVDVLLLCVAGWTSSAGFPERAVRRLSPRAVLLAHWDNFLLPFERGARLLPAMQLPRLVDRLMKTSRDTTVGTVGLLDSVVL